MSWRWSCVGNCQVGPSITLQGPSLRVLVTKEPSWLLSEKTPESVSIGDILRAPGTWQDVTPPSSSLSCRPPPVLSQARCQSPFGVRRHKAESLLALAVNHRQLGGCPQAAVGQVAASLPRVPVSHLLKSLFPWATSLLDTSYSPEQLPIAVIHQINRT